jgi:UDP-N-acetylglucosamine diphosphorylase/glucosamine-1-phosphate N-acetyltransferase
MSVEIFLDESECKEALWPLSATRHVSALLVGILTIKEKWQKLLGENKVLLSKESTSQNTITIPANIIPDIDNYLLILDSASTNGQFNHFTSIKYPWQITQINNDAIRNDFRLLTEGRNFSPLPSMVQAINSQAIFIENDADISPCILNASDGPIYIGKEATIMDGALIRGPFALGENAVVKMGAKIYGATSVGRFSVVGGEIKNSVIFGYSNKAHDGYLGDSVIGEWCNLGAGTSNSNVKNNAGEVYYTSIHTNERVKAGKKAGLIMGDYSRAAINTSFNTGTIVGVCCNIFDSAFPPKLVPDFSWGDEKYDLQKAFRDIENWKQWKGTSMTEEERNNLSLIYSKLK